MTKSLAPLKISTGVITLDIERDGEIVGQLKFNPQDNLFVERFYKMVGEFEVKDAADKDAWEAIADNKEVSDAGVPENMPEVIKLDREIHDFCVEQIDGVFGDGTSELVFGPTKNSGMVLQFFEGVIPHFEQERSEKIAEYTPERKSKKAKMSRK